MVKLWKCSGNIAATLYILQRKAQGSYIIYCNTWTLRLFLAKQGLFRFFLQHMDFHTIPCNSWTLTRFLATCNLTLSLVMHGLLETHGLLQYFLQHSYINSCNVWTLTLFLQHMDSHTYSCNTWTLLYFFKHMHRLSHYFVQRMDSHKFSCNSQPMNTTLFLATHGLYCTLFLAPHELAHFLLQHIVSHTIPCNTWLSNKTTLQSNTLHVCRVDVQYTCNTELTSSLT